MSKVKSAAARKTVEGLENNPSQALLIHYSRQNLMDNESGIATPRIIAIMVKSVDGGQTECFAIHHEAEKADILLENITNYYDLLEERLLRAFNAFVKANRNCKWIHWDMNDVHFSFEAIRHRYCVMVEEEGKDFQEISLQNRVNLNSLLKEIHGDDYEIEPVFENLMKSNNHGVCKHDFLTMEDEAKAFIKLEFPLILKSLVCKVDFLTEILNKTIENSLSISNTKSSKKHRRPYEEHPILALIKSSIFWTVLVFVGGVSFSFGHYFGGAKFDKEKIDLYDDNINLTNKYDSLNKQNKTLKQQNDSLVLIK
jgi:hypothetical protein